MHSVARGFLLFVAAFLASGPEVAQAVELTGIAAVDAGGDHTCALGAAGGVKCWGANSYGQLGDGTTVSRSMPTLVAALGSGVAAITAGGSFTCALTTTGAVKCWGYNGRGALGDGTLVDSPLPVNVVGLSSGVTAISAGGSHMCALVAGGGVKCWGDNSFGPKLGVDTVAYSAVPIDVPALPSGVSAVAAGLWHTCALINGGVKCWGGNYNGEFGDNSSMGGYVGGVYQPPALRAAPGDVLGLTSGVASLAQTYTHSCAVLAGGGLQCWGGNFYGQLGDDSNANRAAPVAVVGLSSGVASAAPGWSHTCARTTGSGVKCWGNNDTGQLGNGTSLASRVPVDVPALANVLSVTSGEDHSCALLAGGAVRCWGLNAYGQLGDGTTTDRWAPAAVIAPPDLLLAPTQLDFGTVTTNTTSAAKAVAITNQRDSAITIDTVAASAGFAVTHDCATLAPATSCTANVTFSPLVAGSAAGTLTIGTGTGSWSVALTGTAMGSLVSHYYTAILGRPADAAGKAYWEGEAARMVALGVGASEAYRAMATAFFFSAEYAAFNRSNDGFVTDLYNTFFIRPPDAAGLAYWSGQLTAGLPREVALVSFLFSTEFQNFMQAIVGTATVRKEVDTVTDFYRGLLARLPDDAGFNFWVQQFRTAQCQGAAAVTAQAEAISSAYALSAEYAARNRNNAQYVGDLYNAFLRRGGDLAGVQFWISQIATGARSRENVRQQFVASPEFSGRVSAIIAQGCLP